VVQQSIDSLVTSNTTHSMVSFVSVNGPTSSSVIRLSRTEIAAHRKDGKCFHCNEFFTQGHKLIYKHLFSIEVLCEEEDKQPLNGVTEPTISLHALSNPI
jgi:hypothetical protein